MAQGVVAGQEADGGDIKRVITASSLGTVFEWYDFFIYGTLAPIIGRTFFPAESPVAQLLLALAGFAVGFGVRPLGAIIFGYLGDKYGRKYTFLITIALMGLATAAVGFVPSAATIGFAAPVIIITLRVLQGLALGGEYGGAAIYVAEHAGPKKRGFFTSFIQASVLGGFLLSLVVVLLTRLAVGPEIWDAWGWRLPFIFSLLLLAISLWMRVKLSESPVFKAMKQAGHVSRNPIKESFTYPGNVRRICVALFGVAAGLTVISYVLMFQSLYFLQNALRVDAVTAQLLVGAGVAFGLIWFIFFGWLSDRIGRKKPIIAGYILTLILLFPLFKMMGSAANPELAAAALRAPVIVSGQDCGYDPFAKIQGSECGRLLDHLSKKGVTYSKVDAPQTGISIGGAVVPASDIGAIDAALSNAGYSADTVIPDWRGAALIITAIFILSALSGMTYGPTAALLCELFPPHIRYSSMSIPYHIGTGYFGGFLPIISQYIVARTGDPYAGLWYAFAVVAMALVVSWFGLKEGEGEAA